MRIGKLYRAAAVFLAAAVSVTCVTAGQAAAVLYRKEPLVFDNFNTDSTLTLTKCQRDAEGMISVPEKINSRAVTAVAPQAFFSCYSVTGIALPDSITTIGMSAFSHCYTLEHIYIPGHIEEIEGSAFSYCSALKEMCLPDGLIGINGSLFYGCTSLESVTIPSTVTYIESSAFTGCSALAEIVFEGTPEQWQEISVGIPNDELGNAVIKYNNTAAATPSYDEPGGYDPYSGGEEGYIGGGGWHQWGSGSTSDEPGQTADYAPTQAAAATQAAAVHAGDANCDGVVNLSDAVTVLQYIANQEKYPLYNEGFLNADCDGIPGITGGDAVYIQMKDAGLC